MIGFNKPYLTGKETLYIQDAVNNRQHISGNGHYTRLCHEFFKNKYGFNHALLTTSCTDALEMCALLIDIRPGDEVIIPSYTFVSTANAFVLRGAKIVFADSNAYNPNIDPSCLEELITSKTRAIVVVHYAGIACDIDKVLEIAERNNLYVIEDAAQSIDAYYKGKPLGSLGHLAAFSFHETKNIISGEGGMLVINDERFVKRAEIIWEKGTNRSAFFRGEVDKYGWVDMGSSFLPSEIIAAFLYAQLEQLEQIQEKRKAIWQTYFKKLIYLEEAGLIKIPCIENFASNNAHMFYMVCKDLKQRTQLIQYLKTHEIQAVFHYLSLHKSPFYSHLHDGRSLIHTDHYSDCLLRLPLYHELSEQDQLFVINTIFKFFNF